MCLVLRFSPPSNLFVGFFKNLLFTGGFKIHQKNNSFSSAQCVRHFSIEMKRELKMNTRARATTENTCSGTCYLCVHFQRYLFARAEDTEETQNESGFLHLFVGKNFIRDKTLILSILKSCQRCKKQRGVRVNLLFVFTVSLGDVACAGASSAFTEERRRL